MILPGTGSITLNKAQPALLGPISLEAPAGAPGFEVKPDKTGKGFDTRGKFLLEGFNLPWVEADITGRLKGNADVRAGNLTIDFLGADGLDLDFRDPRIEAIAAKLGSDKERLFLMNPAAPLGAQEWGISSKGVRFRQRTKESGKEEKQLTVEGAELTGLFYVNDDWGLRLLVSSASVAGDIDVDLLAGSGTIPDLTIDNAVLDLDLAKLSKGGSADSTTSLYDVLEGWDKLIKAMRPFQDVLAHLNGSIDFGVAFEKYLDFYLPIHLAFHNGAINVDKLAEGISSGLPPGVNIEFKVNGDNLELWLNTKALAAGAAAWPVAAPVLIPLELLTSADDVKLLSWTLATGETARASNAGEVSLWTLVSAAKPGRPRVARPEDRRRPAEEAGPTRPAADLRRAGRPVGHQPIVGEDPARLHHGRRQPDHRRSGAGTQRPRPPARRRRPRAGGTQGRQGPQPPGRHRADLARVAHGREHEDRLRPGQPDDR